MNRILIINEKEYTIRKVPLIKYPELISTIKQLPKIMDDVDAMSTEQLITNIPTLVTTYLPDVIAIMAIATDIPKEEAETMGLAEAVLVIEAIIEVNNYMEIYKTLKKKMAHLRVEKTENPLPANSLENGLSTQ